MILFVSTMVSAGGVPKVDAFIWFMQIRASFVIFNTNVTVHKVFHWKVLQFIFCEPILNKSLIFFRKKMKRIGTLAQLLLRLSQRGDTCRFKLY